MKPILSLRVRGRKPRRAGLSRFVNLLIVGAGVSRMPLFAIDPPHVTTALCSSCHMAHLNPGGDLTTVAGNANVCISCHQPGGTASTKTFANGDQALPWSGLPAGLVAGGTSHRWDANAAGHVVFLGGAALPSTGILMPSGVFTGAYAKTYTITINTPGGVGTAQFNWVATTPGGGSGNNVLTSGNVPLDQGVSVAFQGADSASFQLGDQWNIYVLSGLRNPTNAAMALHMTNGVASCSACHDEHNQSNTPFDPAAPAYGGPNTGNGRHFMRVNNNLNQMCMDCHAAHNVTNSLAGSHPVEIPVPTDASHKSPVFLPLEKGSTNLGCLTCHQVHFSPAGDAKLLRLTNSTSVCTDCHLQSDTTTPAAHMATNNNANLWPGGRYGSSMPARTSPTDRGTCLNCHAVHGWPDAANPANRYPKLLADFEENLCYTCHGTNGPAVKQVQLDFAKLRHHPVADSQQIAGRTVECLDCHNAHIAQNGGWIYANTATATRNLISKPLLGVSGVAVNFNGLTNFQAVATNRYTFIPATTGATYEYQICFKCHSAYAWGTGTPPNGPSPNGTALTPVETDNALEFSPLNKSGHPVVTGLDNYTNSTAVGGKKGLLAAAMKAPWNVNVGQQTMSCTDCHNTDAATPAAQGPHGSAAQFILRGPNANNWPNVANSSIGSSWCMNCHNNNTGTPHGGDHSGSQCYVCHIVIPHGGKLSRLIATSGGAMPARYAWNNSTATVGMTSFTKAAAGSYSENGNCRTSCGHHSAGPINETW